MDEKKKEISVNVSSGAEKVESITRQSVQNDGDERLVKTEVVTKSKRLSEEDAAKARVAAALKKQEEKKRKQEEKERKRQERARQKANRKREKERGLNKGYGGWIAAVVSLGVVTLALGATVTVGAIDMAKTKNGVTAGYRATTYELVGIMEKHILEVRIFGGETITYDFSDVNISGNHGGGDNGLMHAVYLERNGTPAEGTTYIDVSIDSHRMAFGAEYSRVTGKTLKI